ncbi:MAG: phosphoenolpyruvate carboxykinase (ATP), partial [Candidatus Heimdallarchaeota archaeon]|nr:phosphoenolpyruvate carboxykinase (ATP) [Candidatus Heimdallarchaeota archaeon]
IAHTALMMMNNFWTSFKSFPVKNSDILSIDIPEWGLDDLNDLNDQTRFVYINPNERVTCIGGIDYYGELKMSILRMAMEITRRDYDGIGLHAGSKICVVKDTTTGKLVKKGGLVFGLSGTGKCLGYNTPIIMYNGTVKMVQDVNIGEQLMGDDSLPRNVISLARGKEMMYKIRPNDGSQSTEYVVNESHILSLKYHTNLASLADHHDKDTIVDISVKDYVKLGVFHKTQLNGYRVKVDFKIKPIKIDPYLLGCLLSYTGKIIKNPHIELFDYLDFNSRKSSFKLEYIDTLSTPALPAFRITISEELFDSLEYYYTSTSPKHIPDDYKNNSRDTRLELLAGLIDAGKTIQLDRGYQITHTQEKLADDIAFLARSLGFGVCKKTHNTHNTHTTHPAPVDIHQTTSTNVAHTTSTNVAHTTYTIYIYGQGVFRDMPVLRSEWNRKNLDCVKDDSSHHLKYSFELQKLKVDNYYGFEIDGNKRFLLGDFTVTHNTTLCCHTHPSFDRDIGENVEVLQDDVNFLFPSGKVSGSEKGFYVKCDNCPEHTEITNAVTSGNAILE